MLVFDTVLLIAFGLYLDQIRQSQFGVAKKWNFICTKQFWCKKKKLQTSLEDDDDETN